MNIKKFVALTFVSTAFALAQETAPVAPAAEPTESSQPVAETPAAEPASAPQPVTETPAVAPVVQADSAKTVAPSSETKAEAPATAETTDAAPIEAGPFDVLHGNAYNTVGNEAAADNVNGLLARPDLFYGKKFFYIEPSSEMGVVSLGSFFAAMDISGDLGRATAGYAANGFGAALHVSLGQFNVDGDNGKKAGAKAGDDIGFDVSKVLGDYVLVLNADWLTFAEENDTDPKIGKSTEEDYRDLLVSASLSNAPYAQKHFWTVGASFLRHENEKKVGGQVQNGDVDSHISITPFFNYGTPALKTSRANLLLGLNTSVPVSFFDEQEQVNDVGDTVKTSLTELEVVLSPNVLAEVAVLKSLMLFGGASYDWHLFKYSSGKDITDDEYTAMESVSDKVNASVGLRYQYEDLLALEFTFGDSFFTDTKAIFNGEGVFVRFGGFVYF